MHNGKEMAHTKGLQTSFVRLISFTFGSHRRHTIRSTERPDTITGQLARAPTNRRSTRKRNNISIPRERHGGEKRREGEEETGDNLQAIDEQESTLNDNDQRGGGERVIAIPVAPKRRSAIKSFDERFEELMKFKDEFGHCNVPTRKSSEWHYSLARWCSNLRISYNQTQKGYTPRYKLAHEDILRLEEADFKWSLEISPRRTFDERFEELLKFKDEFGHCNVPRTKSREHHFSLGSWCKNLRTSYKTIQKGYTPQSH